MNLLGGPRRRKLLFAVLYLSEGAPIGFLWWALPTILHESGVRVDGVTTLLSALAFPWALKFLWAPLVDVLRGPRFGRRGWIVACQLAMALSLAPLLVSEARASLGFLTAALLVHAFAAATQDVAIDALAISETDERERGAINGWMQTGMLLGRSAFGGGALYARRWVGDGGVIACLIGVLLATAAVAALYREAAGSARPTASLGERLDAFLGLLGRVGARSTTWWALAFAVTGGAGFEAVGALRNLYLADRGYDEGFVAWFLAVPSVACMVAGSLLGGWFSDRIGRRRSVAVSGLFLSGSIVALAILDGVLGPGPANEITIVLALVYAGIGLFTATTYALFMDLTAPGLASTEFSAFMGATNLCEVWAAFAAGKLVVSASYASAFALLAVVSLLALPIVSRMRVERV